MITGEAGPTTFVLDNSITLLFLGCGVSLLLRHQAPVVQTLDSVIHWINHYPLDNSIGFARSQEPGARS